ncbi:oxygen-dependent coproporphyrinogen oxidase [Balneolaceae bacterium ANBcel3]|nr:oxygen-dependent coproporphyrinogen oxidase [Balneolaceae bacterium ANBcel3]
MSVKLAFQDWIYEAQESICEALENIDGKARFTKDPWKRRAGGGGLSRVLASGDVIEKGGVNVSVVEGPLPDVIREKFGVQGTWFNASGLSLVIHPVSPMIPAVHANYRYFELYNREGGGVVDSWFGGGADLTPYYVFDEDIRHFHQVHKEVCDTVNHNLYFRLKESCDRYFYNEHRGEARGVGGIFFDYLRVQSDKSMYDWLHFVEKCGNAFLSAYLPLIKRRRHEPWGEKERHFQEVRRGRYVEFNLIHDRGTLFGLKTGGRTESILMSLPPVVRWDYDFKVESGSREEKLLKLLKLPKKWL